MALRPDGLSLLDIGLGRAHTLLAVTDSGYALLSETRPTGSLISALNLLSGELTTLISAGDMIAMPDGSFAPVPDLSLFLASFRLPEFFDYNNLGQIVLATTINGLNTIIVTDPLVAIPEPWAVGWVAPAALLLRRRRD